MFLPLDATTSFRSSDRTFAIQRMITQGGIPTSVEAFAFEMMRSDKDEHFKTVAAILK